MTFDKSILLQKCGAEEMNATMRKYKDEPQ